MQLPKISFEKTKPFLAGLLGAAVFLGVYQTLYSYPKLGTVNINHLVKEHIKTRAQSNLSEDALKKDSQAFMQKLEQVLQELAQTQGLYLIVSEAVIAGSKDYTEAVKQQLEQPS